VISLFEDNFFPFENEIQRLSFVVHKISKIAFTQEDSLLNDEIASVVTGVKNVVKENLTTLFFKVLCHYQLKII
jgi:hypothetical protein